MTREEMGNMSVRELAKYCFEQGKAGKEYFRAYPSNATKNQMIAFVELASKFYDNEGPTAAASAQAAEATEPVASQPKQSEFRHIAPKARKLIRFHSTDKENYPVSIAVNFRRLSYKRGVWLPIEDEYLYALEKTVIKTKRWDSETGQNSEILVPRFTYDLRDAA